MSSRRAGYRIEKAFNIHVTSLGVALLGNQELKVASMPRGIKSTHARKLSHGDL